MWLAAEEATQSIVITGPDGRIAYFNQAFADDVGRVRGGLLGQVLAPLLADLLGVAAAADMVQKLATGIRWIKEVEVAGPGGARIYFQVAATPHVEADGSAGSCLVTLNDVTQLRSAEVELDLEMRVRGALAKALHRTPAEATLEQAAQALCDELLTLPFIEVACVQAYLGSSGGFQTVGRAAPVGRTRVIEDKTLAAWAVDVFERSRAGPWAQLIGADQPAGTWAAALVAEGLKAAAYAPIASGSETVGFLMIGTQDVRFARELAEGMPGLVAFGSIASALLADRMLALRRGAELSGCVKSILASGSFHPVFQPIVDLESRVIVGYEALTRFDSGERPDRLYADAWSVGLGADLEVATLTASIVAASKLPAGRWLDINASPRLLMDAERLKAMLKQVDRPIVLEVTEHDVIADYAAVLEAIHVLGPEICVAVDDAGAGAANFGHIVGLRPDFVKLDIGLIRNVNANLARQAFVVGMCHFSRTAGCRLVAEGIETEEEAATLLSLGVDFGQGFLFGRPDPVEAWVGPRSAAVPAGPEPTTEGRRRRPTPPSKVQSPPSPTSDRPAARATAGAPWRPN